MSVCLSVCVQR